MSIVCREVVVISLFLYFFLSNCNTLSHNEFFHTGFSLNILKNSHNTIAKINYWNSVEITEKYVMMTKKNFQKRTLEDLFSLVKELWKKVLAGELFLLEPPSLFFSFWGYPQSVSDFFWALITLFLDFSSTLFYHNSPKTFNTTLHDG